MVDLVDYVSADKITSAWANLVKDYIQDGTHKLNTLSVDVGGIEVIDSSRNVTGVDGAFDNIGVTQTSVTGNGLSVSRDLASASTDSPLVSIVNDNAGDDQLTLRVQQDGTGNTLLVDTNGEGNGILIDFEATTKRAIWVQADGARISNALVAIIDDNASTNQNTMDIQNDGTGNGLFIDQNGNGRSLQIDSEATSAVGVHISGVATSNQLMYVSNDAASSAAAVAWFIQQDSSSTGNCFYIKNNGTGDGLFINQDGNGTALKIDSEATSGNVIEVFGLVTTGRLCYFYNAGVQTSNEVMLVHQDSAAATVGAVQVRNDGTGNGLFINQDGNGIALNIDSECSNDTDIINVVPAGTSPGAFKVTRNDDVTGNVVMRLGNNYLWVDSTGDLRIDSSAPTSDTSGVVVGTQS